MRRENKIEYWEKENPNKINKVPIQAQSLNFYRMIIPFFGKCLDEHESHWYHTGDHVYRMKTCHQEIK